MKLLNFFLLLWVIFALLDPDQDSEYESGSTDLIEFGSLPETMSNSDMTKEYFLSEYGQIMPGSILDIDYTTPMNENYLCKQAFALSNCCQLVHLRHLRDLWRQFGNYLPRQYGQ